MRKHRLAERLLTDVIGLPWELVHAEACRWEHVMSEDVERRLIELLGQPTESPYGNPIPGLSELGGTGGEAFMEGVESLSEVVTGEAPVRVRIRRISEEVQKDETLMAALHRVGATPDRDVQATQGPEGVLLGLRRRDGRDRHRAGHARLRPAPLTREPSGPAAPQVP